MKIKTAIIMAAGLGERLLPLTAEIPKPLLKIKNKPMIEHLIETLISKQIQKIVIVVGYLHHMFKYLEKKYHNVILIRNYNYDKMNNIASLYTARNYLTDATIILDGDQIINNSNIIKADITKSGYVCYKKILNENEWSLCLNRRHKIVAYDTCNCTYNYILKSISFWTKDDAIKLKSLIETNFTTNTKMLYWDNIAISHFNDLNLYGYVINLDDLIEIDTLNEYYNINRRTKHA